jgi:sugar/nucleoside kinase (ribokinase family)
VTARGFDVVVVGNVGVDTNVYLPGADVDFRVESNFTENLDCVGQAGGYSARAYAQLGLRTAFIGYVGDDFCGALVRAEFARDGIDTTALFIDPGGTGRSVNLMRRDGGRRSFYDGKGHMHLAPDLALCRSVLARSRLAHFSIPNWARRLLPIARDLDLPVACDIQDVVSLDEPYRRDFVAHADILFFSTVNQADPAPLMKALLAASPDQIVVAGLGAAGCALGTRDGIRTFPPVEMEKPVVDTNGAGDTLAAGFVAGYVLEGYSLRDSILRGQIAARHTCALKACSSDLITADELERRFAELRTRYPR